MIKGLLIDSSSSEFSNNISLHTSERIFLQDTLKINPSVPTSVLQVSKPKIAVDTISYDRLRQENLRKIAQQKKTAKPAITISETVTDTSAFVGSTTREYSDFQPSFQKIPDYKGASNQNFLLNIAEKTVDIHYKVKDSTNINTTTVSTVAVPKNEVPTGFEGKVRDYGNSGWYIFMLLISISIFAWGKSLYQKYMLQIVNAVYNYQISIQLFRDKNALFRNLSIILQLLFPINLGLLIYFLIDYFNYHHISHLALANIAIYSFAVFLFFRLKTIIYKFLGLVFKVQEDFNEIQHHMNVYNQTLGVVLLPFIISLPFLNDNIKNVFLVGLVLLTAVFVLLFFFRGFQIVSRKHVPIFFLILYLCAVEILPVVLLVKTSYSII